MTMSRKDEIYDAASKLFAHYGVKKTTIGDIAKEVGIGTGSVYLDFPSKDAIVCGLAQREQEHLAAELQQALRGRGNLATRVLRFFARRKELFQAFCTRGMHAHELLRCTGKEDSPWRAFHQTQVALLADVVGDVHLAHGLLIAFESTAQPGLVDDERQQALEALVRASLRSA